ncbi:MAG TPA: Fe2+-dependent dioxygenase [Parvularcula sp.]|nr:Fe2+-dependent dioxygenase [Parvularcula sp.]HBS31176.1 Fe2+-dependent dioxygenase [Parvularcula sp.]
MILQIAGVLDDGALAALGEALGDPALWIDGRATASGRARDAKANQQTAPTEPAKAALSLIERAILAHAVFQSAAQPEALARLMLNRYGEGMEYGAHVDAPYIGGLRTDLSFTLFLSDPASYDGGALIIDSAGAEDAIKPPAGTLALYPSSFVHRVEKVTRGARLAAVGWVKSRLRSAEHRAMAFELERIGADLAAIDAPAALRDRLQNLRNNFLRAFGD